MEGKTGRSNLYVYQDKRLMNYRLKVKEMEDRRWPKICLREIIRGIRNKNDTRWDGWREPIMVMLELLNEEANELEKKIEN